MQTLHRVSGWRALFFVIVLAGAARAKFCRGAYASPIDVASDRALPFVMGNLQALALPPRSATASNDGSGVRVRAASGELQGGPLFSELFRLEHLYLVSPSLHTLDGSRADFSCVLVHRSAADMRVNVAVFFSVDAASSALNPVLEELVGVLPKLTHVNDTVRLPEFSAYNVLPADLSYFTYLGSSVGEDEPEEGVRWLLIKEHQRISAAQLAAYRRIFPLNANASLAMQPLNGRAVFENVDDNRVLVQVLVAVGALVFALLVTALAIFFYKRQVRRAKRRATYTPVVN